MQDDRHKFEMQKAIRIMMRHIKKFAPRKDKNGWHLQKFHDLLHIVRDIETYGSPNNIDAAITLLILQRDWQELKKETYWFHKSASNYVKQV